MVHEVISDDFIFCCVLSGMLDYFYDIKMNIYDALYKLEKNVLSRLDNACALTLEPDILSDFNFVETKFTKVVNNNSYFFKITRYRFVIQFYKNNDVPKIGIISINRTKLGKNIFYTITSIKDNGEIFDLEIKIDRELSLSDSFILEKLSNDQININPNDTLLPLLELYE